METTTNKNTATLIHLSAFTQYFFPLGNFLFPLLIWTLRKNNSEFVDHNGKQAINFQLSLFVYCVVLLIVSIPVLVYTVFSNVSFSLFHDFDEAFNTFDIGNLTSLTAIALLASTLFFLFKVAEFFLIIYAAVKNSNGQSYTYPFTIRFLK